MCSIHFFKLPELQGMEAQHWIMTRKEFIMQLNITFKGHTSDGFWKRVQRLLKLDDIDHVKVELLYLDPNDIEGKKGYSVEQTEVPCTVSVSKVTDA